MNALTKYKSLSCAKRATAHNTALSLQLKGDVGGGMGSLLSSLAAPNIPSMASDWQQQSKNRESYAFFRSWVYAAVHALGMSAAKQPVNVGKVKPLDDEATENETDDKSLQGSKDYIIKQRRRGMLRLKRAELCKKMTANIRQKAAEQNVEVLVNHDLVKMLAKPNPLQDRFQFVYSFIANLNLTGRAYIVRDQNDDGTIHYYSLPSTWVRPDHQKGPFSRFFITNPRNLDYVGSGEPLDASQVSYAYMPNPADPMGCFSPASSQSAAVRVDDRIQTCKEKFFDNGIFPSVVVTIGKDPHPDVPGGMRPRLTAAQRRQVVGAIRKSMSSVANYGNPAIVDGLIEAITPFSREQSQLGWEKSEPEIKTRILSAFGVHPFILGEPVGVGGYAQTYNIMSVFYDRINTFLDILSILMTGFVNTDIQEPEENEEEAQGPQFGKVNLAGGVEQTSQVRALEIVEKAAKPKKEVPTVKKDEVLIWWEMAAAQDPQLDWSNWNQARTRGDVTKNETRAKLGMPPDEENEDPRIDPTLLTGIQGVMVSLGMGSIQPSQAEALFVGIGVPEDLASKIAGVGLPKPDPMGGQGGGGGGYDDQGQNPNEELDQEDEQDEENDQEPQDEEKQLSRARRALLKAVKVLQTPVDTEVNNILLQLT